MSVTQSFSIVKRPVNRDGIGLKAYWCLHVFSLLDSCINVSMQDRKQEMYIILSQLLWRVVSFILGRFNILDTGLALAASVMPALTGLINEIHALF